MPEAPVDARDLVPAIEVGALELGITLPSGAAGRLAEYLVLLERWNKTFNLTAVRDIREMVARHVVDSLAVLPHLRDGPVLDMGTGAGLPGFVVALVRPDLDCVLVDSVGKKTRFCQQVVGALELTNVRVVNARLEHRLGEERFGTVTARALAPLGQLVELARTHLRPGGRLVAMKGPQARAEIAASRLGAGAAHCYPVEVPGVDGQRFIITVDGLTESVP